MIHIQPETDTKSALTTDFITDKQPLTDYAGFEPGSRYAGVARDTFSLVLSAATVRKIHDSITVLYDQLLMACWPTEAVLPFDMVRFDAFLDPVTDSLKIIELNTRNVGLHEIVEWLDDVTAETLAAEPIWSLNAAFVGNQQLLHQSTQAPDAPLLYMTKPMIPKWKYYEALQVAYPSVCHVTDPAQYRVAADGIVVDSITYTSITRKFSWPTEVSTEALNSAGVISIVQPLWMRPFGHKDYLQELHSPAMLQTELFNTDHLEAYRSRKDSLVLKIINAGGSKSIYLGAQCNDEQWLQYLQQAQANPTRWVLQEFYPPPKHDVVVHGKAVRSVPLQLGIFVLPKPSAPHECNIDIVVKGYGGTDKYFTFDPSGLNPDIWFGNVIVQG